MTASLRSAARSRAALVLALLSMLVAVGTTSYAAGLAKNSVGTQQLKQNAVTSAKIKNGAVGKKDLAKSAVPRTTAIDTRLAEGASVALGAIGGIAYKAVCQASGGNSAQLYLESTKSASNAISVRGLLTRKVGVTQETYPLYNDAQGSYIIGIDHGGSIGTVSVEARVRHQGKPGSVLHLTLASADGGTKPCLFDVVITPTK